MDDDHPRAVLLVGEPDGLPIRCPVREGRSRVGSTPDNEVVIPVTHVVGHSPAMAAVYRQLRQLARGDLPVLLTGETGVDKEHVARILHASSDHSRGPFVAVNCAAIPAELLEAKLLRALQEREVHPWARAPRDRSTSASSPPPTPTSPSASPPARVGPLALSLLTASPWGAVRFAFPPSRVSRLGQGDPGRLVRCAIPSTLRPLTRPF